MYEQKELYKSIEEKTMLFDAELKALRHERARIAIFMKNADLRYKLIRIIMIYLYVTKICNMFKTRDHL